MSVLDLPLPTTIAECETQTALLLAESKALKERLYAGGLWSHTRAEMVVLRIRAKALKVRAREVKHLSKKLRPKFLGGIR